MEAATQSLSPQALYKRLAISPLKDMNKILRRKPNWNWIFIVNLETHQTHQNPFWIIHHDLEIYTKLKQSIHHFHLSLNLFNSSNSQNPKPFKNQPFQSAAYSSSFWELKRNLKLSIGGWSFWKIENWKHFLRIHQILIPATTGQQVMYFYKLFKLLVESYMLIFGSCLFGFKWWDILLLWCLKIHEIGV